MKEKTMVTFDLNNDNLTPARLIQWGDLQTWGKAMKECLQNPQWHAEGDVWTHTQMVCHSLVALKEWQGKNTLERNILLLAALLHDCGKPAVTRWENGRLRSKKHGIKGAYLARKILRDAGIKLDTRERIVNLVHYHNQPSNIFKSENQEEIEKTVAMLSWQVELPLLVILAEADTLGGISEDSTHRLDRIELFKLQAEEMDCFSQPFRPLDDHARFLCFREELTWLDYKYGYKPFEDFCCTVTMMSGLPGAGKDHWINHGAGHGKGDIISLDQIRNEMNVSMRDNQGQVIQAAKKRMRELLAEKSDFIFNATNTVWRWRRNYISLFHQYGANIRIVYVEPQWEVLLNRNRNRKEPVPQEVLLKKYDRLDIPAITECHQLQYIT